MWNAERGYGFIADDSGGPDMFLHISALQSAGIDQDNIRKGERLTFDATFPARKRPSASRLTRNIGRALSPQRCGRRRRGNDRDATIALDDRAGQRAASSHL